MTVRARAGVTTALFPFLEWPWERDKEGGMRGQVYVRSTFFVSFWWGQKSLASEIATAASVQQAYGRADSMQPWCGLGCQGMAA